MAVAYTDGGSAPFIVHSIQQLQLTTFNGADPSCLRYSAVSVGFCLSDTELRDNSLQLGGANKLITTDNSWFLMPTVIRLTEAVFPLVGLHR